MIRPMAANTHAASKDEPHVCRAFGNVPSDEARSILFHLQDRSLVRFASRSISRSAIGGFRLVSSRMMRARSSDGERMAD